MIEFPLCCCVMVYGWVFFVFELEAHKTEYEINLHFFIFYIICFDKNTLYDISFIKFQATRRKYLRSPHVG